MRRLLFLLVIVPFFIEGTLSAKSYTIVNSGYKFSPDSITVNVGDEVVFSLASIHNVVEVSKNTWDTNGNTSNGGFSLPFGGGTITLTETGTFYYVCFPHAGMGMKGRIIVINAPTSVQKPSIETNANFIIYPNPARDHINFSFSVPGNNFVKIDLLDITGNKVSTLISAEYPQGDYSLSFPLNNIITGRYFLRYTCGDLCSVKPVVIFSNL